METKNPMSEIDIESIAQDAVDQAIDFVESEIAEDRIKAQRYYDGQVDIGEEDGRSKAVSTKVRDTVRAIKPSLMRIFLSNENYVEYLPNNQQDVAAAETATKYMHMVFNRANGYRVLSDAIHDALLKKVGIVKCWWDESEEVKIYEHSNVTEMELALLSQDDGVEIVEATATPVQGMDEFGMPIETNVYELKIAKTCTKGKLAIESVPPEEFFVSASAKSLGDAYVCGTRTDMRVGDLVEMGYPYDEVVDLSDGDDTTAELERFERNSFEDVEENIRDPAMREVPVTEAYMRIDVDGVGVPQLHRIILAGAENKMLEYERCSRVPFAVFEVDPEPHTFFGKAVADLIINDQDVSTAMLRGLLDNVAITNNPQRGAVEGQVNVDDLLNNEIGAIVRMRSPGAVQDLSVPFVAGQTLGAIEYFDQTIEQKTGVSRASNGLDPDALQNSTATAVQLTLSAGQAQIEVMARNLAEGGMTQLFRLMLQIVAENSDEEELMRVGGGSFQAIDPRSWNVDMGISANVGLGTGQDDQKAIALQQTLQNQMMVYQNYGPSNGLVSLTNIRNTLADQLAIGGMRNADRYYQPMSPDIEQQMMQAQAQNQGEQQVDPLVQAEQVKAEAKKETDMMKLQLEAQKEIAKDDRERDQMDADLLVEAAKILGQWGVNVDVEQIRAMQTAPRYPDEQPATAATVARY